MNYQSQLKNYIGVYVSNRRVAAVLAAIGYYALIEAILVRYILPVWGYIGFSRDIESYVLFLNIFTVACLSVICPQRISSCRRLALNIYFILFVIPVLSLYGCLTVEAGVAVLVFLIGFFICNIPTYSLVGRPYFKQSFLLFVLSSIAVTLALFVLMKNGFGSINFNVREVYEFRGAQKGGLPVVVLMLMSWLTKFMLPALLVFSYFSGNLYRTALLLAFSLLCFSVINVKAAVVYPVLSLVVAILLRKGPLYLFQILVFVIVGVLSVMAIGLYGDFWILPAFLVRRAIYTPAMIYGEYMEYFQHFPYLFWGIMGDGTSALNGIRVGEAVSAYFGRASNASTGFVASGFSEAGVWGSLFYGVLFFIIMWMLDISSSAHNRIAIMAISTPLILHVILNGDLFTSITYHGLGALVMFTFFLNSRGDINIEKGN